MPHNFPFVLYLSGNQPLFTQQDTWESLGWWRIAFLHFSLTGRNKIFVRKIPPGSLLLPVTSHVDFSRSTYTKTTPTLPLWGLYRQREICQKKGKKRQTLSKMWHSPNILLYPKVPKSRNDFLRWENHNDVISLSLSLVRPRSIVTQREFK
jgi:hypothetical protein